MPSKRNTSLRAVTDADIPTKPPVRLSVTEAAEAGDQLELLVAMRRRVAEAVENPNCPPRDLAALSRRLQEIGREIEALRAKANEEASEDDDAAPDEEWDSEAI